MYEPCLSGVGLAAGIGCGGIGVAAVWWSSGIYIYWRRRRYATAVSYGLLGVGIGLLCAGTYLLIGAT
jgi:hypothetical protein